MRKPFEGINNKNIKKLLDLFRAHTYTYQENHDLLSTFMGDNIIGIILEGTARIIRTNFNGEINIIEELNSNDVFSTNISSLDTNEYSIITKSPTKVIIIEYNELIKNTNVNYLYYNIFLQNLFQILNEKIKARNERIRILSRTSIRNKILEYLSIESQKHHSNNIYLPSTFTDLANYLSVDRSAMTREISAMKNEGFIEVKGKKITILYNR